MVILIGSVSASVDFVIVTVLRPNGQIPPTQQTKAERPNRHTQHTKAKGQIPPHTTLDRVCNRALHYARLLVPFLGRVFIL